MATIKTGGNDDELGESRWENFEHQHVSTVWKINAGDLTGDDSPGNLARETLAPAGGLERGELAELVYLQSAFRCYIVDASGTGSTSGQLLAELEIFKDVKADWQVVHDYSQANIDDNDTPLVSSKLSESTKDHSYLRQNAMYQQNFDDDTNGTGGAGGGDAVHRDSRHLRHEMGRGPMYDDEDRIAWDAGIDVGNLSDEQVIVQAQTDLVWDLFEYADRPTLTDIRPVSR